MEFLIKMDENGNEIKRWFAHSDEATIIAYKIAMEQESPNAFEDWMVGNEYDVPTDSDEYLSQYLEYLDNVLANTCAQQIVDFYDPKHYKIMKKEEEE